MRLKSKSDAGPSKRILLIEDDALVRKSMTLFMASMGYEVLAADSGERGLQVLDRERVDLMVADYQLPGITGIDVIRTLRQRGIRIPVVLMSADLNEETEALAQSEQVSAIFKKSTDQLQQLKPTLLMLLHHSS